MIRHWYTGLLVLFIFVAIPADAQLFKPFTAFRVIKTERFDIIFPKESESSARLLASYADRVYDQVSSLLGIEFPGRIPVTFAPYTDIYNAYYRPAPSNHIVLFDTPINLEWTSFANSLESLFLHELTHAVSLSTRSPAYRVLHRIFGSWVTPSYTNTPLFMVEGVTVSFESLGGFGRANDPLIKQIVRQSIYEDKFPTPFQASGVHDIPGQNGNFYEYGGLFSAWLQQTYGMEKYAALWQGMGRDAPVSYLHVYRSGYYSIFRSVYKIEFMDAWNAFRASLALDGIEENPGEIFPKKYHFLTEKRNTVSALAAGGNNVYVLDGTEEKIRVYDTLTGQTRAFNTDFWMSYDLDVSADDTTLLVSGYRVLGNSSIDGQFQTAAVEQRTDSGRKTGRAIRGLFRARYFRDGVIGIRSELHNACIVYEDFNGNSEILFRGNEELSFSGPQVVDDERIVFIAARKGVRELMLYNYASGELFRIENIENTEDSGDNEYWRYARGLGVSDGKIFFSHNSNDRMYKLASVDLAAMRAVFSQRDFSGGVFSPVSAGGEIYYRGDFFSGDGVLRFPEAAWELSGTQTDITLAEADSEQYGMVARANMETNAHDWNVLTEPPASEESKRYYGIKYMNPFQLWFPVPLLRDAEDDKLRLDGGGLFSVIMDPTDRNLIQVIAYADIRYRMAAIETFSWQTTVPGFPLTLQFSDMVTADPGYIPYRDTRVGLNAGLTQAPGRWAYVFSLGGTYIRIAPDDGGESAYEWDKPRNYFFPSAGLLFTNLNKQQHELFGNGLSLSLSGASIVDIAAPRFEPRAEGIFQASAETRFPLNLTLYGAYDEWGMNLHGGSRIVTQPLFARVASTEYPLPKGLNLTWLAGGEASVGLFSLEIQKNLSHIYFNRFFGTLSLRNVLYDAHGRSDVPGIAINDLRLAQSLVLRLNLVSSIIPIKSAPVSIEPYFWGSWNFSDTITGREGIPFNFGFGVRIPLAGLGWEWIIRDTPKFSPTL